MTTRLKTAQLCFLLIAIGFTVMGMIYTFSPSIQPYHLDAIGKSWGQVAHSEQLVWLAIMRGSGSGAIAAGFSIFVLLLIPFRNGEDWARWSMLTITLIEAIPTIYSIMQLKQHTPGEPPLALVVTVVILAVAGTILSHGCRRIKQRIQP